MPYSKLFKKRQIIIQKREIKSNFVSFTFSDVKFYENSFITHF